jgi:16S rRNA A1518/A1519 N6-dimethyltransferase RsmA/KsgA/DIM1 with predicted DNA glycosylase/AP lyase activity
MLRATLRVMDSEIEPAAEEAEVDPTRRPEDLTPGEFVRLANALARRAKGSR